MKHLFDKEISKKEDSTEKKSKPKSLPKKKYNFYIGYGWLSDDELFELRQSDPRYAP